MKLAGKREPLPATGARGMVTGEDFDQALRVAERLLTIADQAYLRIRALRALQLAIVLVYATLAVGAPAALVGSRELITLEVVAAVAGVAGLAVVEFLLLQPLRQRMVRDESAMVELVTILRELHPHVAEREGWSGTRERITRGRISRFPIAGRSRR